MLIKVPHRHDFSESLKKKILEVTKCALPEWEVSVPIRDDLAWSIVLSYLISTDYESEEDFSSRLKALTGSVENVRLVKKAIKNFNPFRNRFSCFFDEVLKQVVNDFKTNLNWKRLFTVSDKLLAASDLLNCVILCIWDDPELGKYSIYMENVKESDCMITLKSSNFIDDCNESNKLYNFMLKSSLGSKMKRSALLYFLKEVKMSKKEISILKSVEERGNHLLNTLLKEGSYNIVLKLYKSPYIVSKISEAGYEMDPRSRDEGGLSAVYYALGNPEIMYMLYYFAVNNCCLSEGSYRNPDSCIVSNLLHMKEILSTDLEKLEDRKDDPKYDDRKKTFEELLEFNRFLVEINGNMVKIKNRLNYYKAEEDDAFEANKRREIIVILLDTYKDFFNIIFQENSVASRLDEYVLHRNYYNLIDMATAVLFFDNIIFLKERLALENVKQFSEMESSFCLSIIYLLTFKDIEKEISNSLNPLRPFHPKNVCIFPLLERLHNFEKTKEFSNTLRNTVISKDNIRTCIPESEIYSILHPYPEFKDAIEKGRLQFYINTALTVKIKNVQSVLVIENALRVIGEFFAQERNDDCFLRRFLRLCFPKDISSMLLHVRNKITYTFSSKFECEKNLALFRSIQKELIEIEKRFKIVYHIVDLNFSTYYTKQIENELERVKTVIHLYSNTSQEPFYLDKSVIEWVKNYPSYSFTKAGQFLSFFEIALRHSEEDIKHEMSKLDSDNLVNIINEVVSTLKPLKRLLEIIQRCSVYNVENILESFQILENCNEKNATINVLKNKTDNLLENCNKFLSTHTVKKRRSLKPLNSLKNIKHFLQILKGFVFLSNEEKDDIRKEIPHAVRQSVSMKEMLIHSINNGFSYDIDRESDLEITYISKNKMKEFKKLYRSKDSRALTILNTPDPIEELDEIFSKNCAEKKKYDSLCKKMQFSEETREKLGKLVAGQRKKCRGNDLKNLLNRIQLLKKIIIQENEEVFSLWVKVKSKKSKQLIFDKIVQRYLENDQQQMAVDMLLFDCMNLYQTVKGNENPWIKTSKLYSGLNLRNVISHGSPLLEFLCKLLDPEDLPSEKIKKIIRLVEDEDAIKAILELYERMKNDFGMFLKILNSEEKDEYCDLRDRIFKCYDWKDYSLLLEYNSKREDDKR